MVVDLGLAHSLSKALASFQPLAPLLAEKLKVFSWLSGNCCDMLWLAHLYVLASTSMLVYLLVC